MKASGLFYVRFMDDILVLAPTLWRFRKAVHEQEPGETCASARLGMYVWRWRAKAGRQLNQAKPRARLR